MNEQLFKALGPKGRVAFGEIFAAGSSEGSGKSSFQNPPDVIQLGYTKHESNRVKESVVESVEHST